MDATAYLLHAGSGMRNMRAVFDGIEYSIFFRPVDREKLRIDGADEMRALILVNDSPPCERMRETDEDFLNELHIVEDVFNFDPRTRV